ncbi:MAG: insulinase family protein [Gammaproteobacteria bacterium]|nr:insulinase family protein [Gammaproteobacteria bacterium]
MKIWTILLSIFLIVACEQGTQEKQNQEQVKAEPAIAGVTFIEEIKAEPGKTIIPYKKYLLDNGLKVILHEDHSDPLVHVDVTFHVGSAREEIGKSGFAHFFEHMMFQGSENVGDEQHFKLITEAGGTMNGTTNTDRTNYFQTVPANQLEKVLWLEADRMGFLLDAVTQEKYEVQRETVKNERGQRIDNRPYGRMSERVLAALYPEGHPYSWPVIGFMEDLNRVNVNDLKAFFLRWYGPNNATLTIGGDLEPQETLALVNKYFGSIKRGPDVNMPEKPKVTLAKDRYISMEDNVHLPLLYMTYPTVYVRHEDEAPLDILSSILGGGKTSLLYKNLVKNQIAVQAATNHPCSELACSFRILALPHPASGKSLADIEKIIRETLVEFEGRGVEDDDLIKAKASMETGFIFGMQSVRGKVSTLARHETYTGNPNAIGEDILRYANVTKEDVMRVFNQYIKGKSAVIMSVVPNGKPETVALADNYKPAARNLLIDESETSSDELEMRKTKDNFDRSQMPVAGANKAVDVPKMWQGALSNGIQILGTQSLETPTTSLLLKIKAGRYYETKDKAGTATLLAAMFSESTLERSGEEMSKELQKLGSTVSVSSSSNYLNVNINALTKNFDATMKLVKEKLMQPAFLENEFTRIKNNTIQGVKHSKKDASYLARVAMRQLLNADNIASVDSSGSEASLANITLADVKAYYENHFKPAAGQLIVVSDLDKKAIMSELNNFADWKGEGPTLDLELAMHNSKKGIIYLVHKDNAAQSVIRISKRSITKDITGEYYRAYLMNFPLGGAFNSRINLNLREDKGYTYGARSAFSADQLSGTYIASGEVRADVTDKSLVEFVNEITHYADKGITPDELTFMKNAINQKDALKYETPGAKLRFLAQILEYNLTPDFVKQRAEIVDNITAEEINALAKKHLDIKEMIFVVVGNSEVLKPQLEALGYEVVNYEI